MPTTIEPKMPIVANAPTKPGGEPYTVDDKEYWLLQKDGGIRRHQRFEYPAMRYRAFRGEGGKIQTEYRTVQNEAEDREMQAQGWIAGPDKAIEALDAKEREVAQAAAEVAAAATKMSAKAQAEYRKRSAESADHITQ